MFLLLLLGSLGLMRMFFCEFLPSKLKQSNLPCIAPGDFAAIVGWKKLQGFFWGDEISPLEDVGQAE